MNFVKKISSLLQNVFFKKKNAKESVAGDASKFAVAFAISSTALYFLLSLTGNFLHKLAALSSELAAKNFLGLQINASYANFFPVLEGVANATPFSAEINDLCAGALELALMAGLLLASRDKPLEERGKGIFFGAIVLLLFNPLRISLTLAAVGTPLLALVHDVLFRLGLVLLLVAFYALWYYWSAGRKNES